MNREKERKQLFKDLQASLAREKDGMTMQRRIIDRMVDAAAGDGEADSVQVRLGEIILEKVAGKESPRPAEEKESGPKVIYIGGERREPEPAAASNAELPRANQQQDTPPAELAPPESEPQTPTDVRTDAINGPDRAVRLRRLEERNGGLRGVDGATVNELMRGRDRVEITGPICKNLTKRNAGKPRG